MKNIVSMIEILVFTVNFRSKLGIGQKLLSVWITLGDSLDCLRMSMRGAFEKTVVLNYSKQIGYNIYYQHDNLVLSWKTIINLCNIALNQLLYIFKETLHRIGNEIFKFSLFRTFHDIWAVLLNISFESKTFYKLSALSYTGFCVIWR